MFSVNLNPRFSKSSFRKQMLKSRKRDSLVNHQHVALFFSLFPSPSSASPSPSFSPSSSPSSSSSSSSSSSPSFFFLREKEDFRGKIFTPHPHHVHVYPHWFLAQNLIVLSSVPISRMRSSPVLVLQVLTICACPMPSVGQRDAVCWALGDGVCGCTSPLDTEGAAQTYDQVSWGHMTRYLGAWTKA